MPQWNKLSVEEYEQAPADIQTLILLCHYKVPFSGERIEWYYTTYPEYFDEELERRRKWGLVPESVHDAYNQEMEELNRRFNETLPVCNKGLWYYIQHPEEYNEWRQTWDAAYPERKRQEEDLHKKYYAPYGL
jgi:hypothetical protein